MSEAQQQRYRVVERLASGGMAEVYLAESAGIEGFKKNVAIKRVLPHLSEKKRFIAMFLDEARLSANLTHSNVAQVFDIGVGDNAYFIVMEYVDGADLKVVIESLKLSGKTLPVEAAVFIAAKICEGLSYAHELTTGDGAPLHVVHRDMSPPNVLITKYGEVKIVDFGLAKATSQLEKSEAGIIKGKFSYLSPEAALGEEVDHRTDIFAVGIILWEMIAGRRLFLGDTDFQTVKLVQQAKIPELSKEDPTVPPELDKILAKALARDPAARYESARELGIELTRFLYSRGNPVSSYDIADFVRTAMKHRKKVQPDKAVTIDRLIEEALLEFKSLQDDGDVPTASRLSSAPKTVGFEDISHWADEIGLPSQQTEDPPQAKPVEKPKAREEAPKEEPASAKAEVKVAPKAETKVAPKERAGLPAVSKTLASEPGLPTTPKAARSEDDDDAPVKIVKRPEVEIEQVSFGGGGGKIKAILVVAALVVIAVGAWFGGLIPH
jgi:eukaryotic-like serine/threonine-protein kinase